MGAMSTPGTRSMYDRSSHQAAICVAAIVMACSLQAQREATSAGEEEACGPIARPRFGAAVAGRGQDSGFIDAVVPSEVRTQFVVFYADTLDINCDGRPDVVGFGEARVGREASFFAFVAADGHWREVLRASSPVEGVEKLALAADLLGSGRLDVITISSDEGGYVLRLFVWQKQVLTSIEIPRAYNLRNEEAWDETCLRRIEPQLVAPSRLSLLRETISLSDVVGHGTSCELPRDTLEIRGQALQRVR